MKKLSEKVRNWLATILGLLTAVATALAVIDFNNFDIKKDWFRLIVIALPAIGGYFSTIRQGNEKK